MGNYNSKKQVSTWAEYKIDIFLKNSLFSLKTTEPGKTDIGQSIVKEIGEYC